MAVPLAPIEFKQPTPAEPVSPSPAAVGEQAGGIYKGIGAVLQLGADYAEKEYKARATQQVSDAVTRTTDALDKARIELDKDPDFAGREAKFETARRKIYDEEMEKLSGRFARTAFHEQQERVTRTMSLQVRHEARDSEIQIGRQSIMDNLDKTMTQALFARSPQEREALLMQVDTTIRNGIGSGHFSQVQARALHKSLLVKFDAGQAAELIRSAPGEAIKRLRDPEQFKNLDANTRQALMLQATTRSESLGVQARADYRADHHMWRTVRSDGMDVDPKEEAKLRERAHAAGHGAQFDAEKLHYDRVRDLTRGRTAPQLREDIDKLTATGNIADALVARALQRTVAGVTREDTQEFQRRFKDWDGVRQSGGQVDDATFKGLRDLANSLMGKAGTDMVDERAALHDRVGDARTKGPTGVAAALQGVEDRQLVGRQLVAADYDEMKLLHAALVQKVAQLKKDPREAIDGFYPTLKTKFDAAAATQNTPDDPNARLRAMDGANEAYIEAQRREGVPEHEIKLFTIGQAEAVNKALQKGGTEAMDTIAMLKANYSPRYWEMVKTQLTAKEKLPAVVDIAIRYPQGSVDADNSAKVMGAAFRTGVADYRKALGETVVKEVDGAVLAGSDHAAKVLLVGPDGVNRLSNMQRTVERVAYYLMTNDKADKEDAVKRAWNIVFDKHTDTSAGVSIMKVNGVPIANPMDVMEDQRQAMRDLRGGKYVLLLPQSDEFKGETAAQRRAAYMQVIEKEGRWVTNSEGTGQILITGMGRPVLIEQDGVAGVPLQRMYPKPGRFTYYYDEDNGEMVAVPVPAETYGPGRGANPAAPRPVTPEPYGPDEPYLQGVGRRWRQSMGYDPRGQQPSSSPDRKPPADRGGQFNADGSGYDMQSARRAGLKPDETGHWQSVLPLQPDEAKRLGLPEDSGLMLKGTNHETWRKTIEEEMRLGRKLAKIGDRYYTYKGERR